MWMARGQQETRLHWPPRRRKSSLNSVCRVHPVTSFTVTWDNTPYRWSRRTTLVTGAASSSAAGVLSSQGWSASFPARVNRGVTPA